MLQASRSEAPSHSQYEDAAPLFRTKGLKKKRGGGIVLHSRQELKYATSIALSFETTAASLTNVDRTKPWCSFYSRHSDLQPILFSFFKFIFLFVVAVSFVSVCVFVPSLLVPAALGSLFVARAVE